MELGAQNPAKPSRQQSRDVELAILEAARDLLAAGGVEALSMRQVADRVGISATAIYHYFSGKEELVDRVVRKGFERFGSYLERGIAPYAKGSLDRGRALGEAYLRFALENQAYFRVIFSIQPQDPRALDDLPEGGGYPLLRRTVEEAMESGAMRRADPDLMAMFLWSLTHGLVTLALVGAAQGCDCTGKRVSPIELYHAFSPFVRAGIQARADGGEREDEDARIGGEVEEAL